MTHRELSVRDIIDRFSGKDVCLMKHALIAKAEEDKKETVREMVKLEEAKAYSHQLHMELMKEQAKHSPHNNNDHLISPASITIPLLSSNSNHSTRFFQPATPTSPIKRNYSAIDSTVTNKSLYHNKVMKALREKIIKSNSKVVIENNKRQRTLPKLNIIQDNEIFSADESPTKSLLLRLPPIDTHSTMVPPLSPNNTSTSSSSSPSTI